MNGIISRSVVPLEEKSININVDGSVPWHRRKSDKVESAGGRFQLFSHKLHTFFNADMFMLYPFHWILRGFSECQRWQKLMKRKKIFLYLPITHIIDCRNGPDTQQSCTVAHKWTLARDGALDASHHINKYVTGPPLLYGPRSTQKNIWCLSLYASFVASRM